MPIKKKKTDARDWDVPSEGEMEVFLKSKRGYVWKCAESVYNSSREISGCGSALSVDDLYQVGLIRLWRSIKSHDSTQGSSFKTYAVRSIRGEMLSEIRKMSIATDYYLSKKGKVDFHHNAEDVLQSKADDYNLQQTIEDRDLIEKIFIFLNPRESAMCFALVVEGKLLKEVASDAGVSPARAGEIRDRYRERIEKRFGGLHAN